MKREQNNSCGVAANEVLSEAHTNPWPNHEHNSLDKVRDQFLVFSNECIIRHIQQIFSGLFQNK